MVSSVSEKERVYSNDDDFIGTLDEDRTHPFVDIYSARAKMRPFLDSCILF